MKTMLKKLTALMLAMLMPVNAETIRTLRPDGGGMKVEDRTPFITALGGTTAGQALFQLPNPSSITFIRINADNSVSLLDAAGFRNAIGAAPSTGAVLVNPSLSGTVAVQDGALAIADTNGLQTALNSKRTVFRMIDYGADAAGAGDSTGAWNSMVAAASAAGGNAELLFTAGTYKGNFTLTNSQLTRRWKITGEGGGSVGDWTAVEAPGKTLIRPNNNALPVFTFEMIRGVTMEDMEIRGNGAGTSVSGILIDNPAAAFAGNGLFGKGVVIRGFTNGLHSIGGCNIIFRESGLFNNNVGIRIPSLALAHSYRFEQCSLGGLATVLSGSGTSRILQVEDGSFIDLLGCEMGNCTDLAYTAGSAILNVIGGNMESMPGTNNVLITMNGGNVNLSGVRLGAGNRTVVRAFGGTGEILGVSLTGNQAQGAMTMFDHHGIGYADLRGNGLSKTVTEYTDNTFTTIRGSSVCERLVVSARMTANQVIGATGTHTVIFPVEGADVGGKHNTTTGEFAPGKRGNYRFSAGLDVDSGTTAPQLGVYINGSLRATLSQFVTSGGGTGTFVTGSQIVPMGAGDIATIRVVTGGAATIRSSSNYTSMLSIEELPYWN